MAEKSTGVEFQFVNSTISAPNVPQDFRALIRKQAMKKASAARKQAGNYGKHNLRQYPVFIIDSDHIDPEPKIISCDPISTSKSLSRGKGVEGSNKIKAKDVALRQKQNKLERAAVERQQDQQLWLAKLAVAERVPPSPSPKGYELMSQSSRFDILELSTLATLHVGRATRSAISANPYFLVSQLKSSEQWSYLSFLPSRYGHIACLNDAVDCAVARAKQILSPSEIRESIVIAFYLKALGSLQKALDNPQQRYTPEVLCATEILALYELLDPTGEVAWIRHSAGAARLIQLRGPKNYNTEFEKALFIAHTGTNMTECLLNNERCFLEQDIWQAVFQSLINKEDSPIADRSEIVITLFKFKSFIPGLVMDVTNLICHTPSVSAEAIIELTSRIRAHRSRFLLWLSRWKALVDCAPYMTPGSAEFDRRSKVFATYLSCHMLSNRLLAAVSAMERKELEKETQCLAGQMLKLEVEVKTSDSSACLFMAQTMGVAGATRASPEWGDVDENVEGPLIERKKFERWCWLFGRKTN
ncbi:hypothetical protein B7494_g7626 [Chlorociboria aeruginascens]|nr:hypothetical protein B7494_g7626 [Chlorociboria aeruginascens]